MKRKILLTVLAVLNISIFVRPVMSANESFNSISANTDYHTGGLTMGVPIDIPSGRAGLQPSLQLLYSSNSSNDSLGVGWLLDLGSVQRSIKRGVPKYDLTDTFIFKQAGSVQELVDVGGGRFAPKIEGAFMKIEFVNDTYWRIKDKSGVTYYFGEDQASQEHDPSNNSKIFKWCLNRIEDVHGNSITFDYLRDGNVLYLERAQYSGNSRNGLLPFSNVGFVYGPRADQITNYNAGFKKTISKRLESIDVEAENQLQRKYTLEYAASNRTNRSLLTSITQYASDSLTSLPPVTLEYQEDSDPTYTLNTFSGSVAGNNRWNINWAGGYDRGNDNYGPVPPYAFGVTWQGPSDGAIGSRSLISWNVNSNGFLSFSAVKDAAYWMWTYLYVDTPRTLYIPYSTSGVDGMWLNNVYTHVGHYWSLQAGYNLIEMTFYNQNQTFNFNLNSQLANQVDLMSTTQVSFPVKLLGDFNGDGFTDTADFTPSSGKVEVMISNGTGFDAAQTWINGFGVNTQLTTGDFNGDGKVDICSFNSSNGYWRVALSDGSGFNDGGNWITGFGPNKKISTGDFNGDGLTDITFFYSQSGTMYASVALDTGNSFQIWTAKDFIISSSSSDAIAVDFNGDGLTDLATYESGTSKWYIALNEGDLNSDFEQLSPVLNAGTNSTFLITDADSDGLMDLGVYNYSSGQVKVVLSEGMIFETQKTLPFQSNLTSSTARAQASDFNGDGLSDYVIYTPIGSSQIAYSNGEFPDLLSSTENGVGGEKSITYTPSTELTNTFLPFAIQTVKSVTASTSGGDSYTTTYDYSGGLWDHVEREFRGFQSVKVTDTDGNYTETEYLQDDTYKGRVAKQQSFDCYGNLRAKVMNTWSPPQELFAGVTFVWLKRKDNFIYNGVSATEGKRTAEEYFYDEATQLGNLTKVLQLGEVNFDTGEDIGSDTRTVETAYINNTSGDNWLVGFPRETIVKNHAGNIVRKTWFDYDNQANGETPTLGLLTRKKDWAGDAPEDIDPETTYSYDTYGNLKTTKDPKQKTTEIDYDTDYEMFPLTTRNALNHTVVNEHYGINGVAMDSGLWGQLKTTTDPNQKQGLRAYDSFGRVKAAVSPLDSIVLPTMTGDYEINPGQYYKVTTSQRKVNGQEGTVEQKQFYDGLGRLMQSKTKSGIPGQYIVYDQVEYNIRGLPKKQYLPYFTTVSLDTPDALDPSKPYTIISYDCLGRTTKITNPDNTYKTITYDDWVTTTIDENGHKQESEFDAYGRLIEKREYLGADGRGAPTYPQTPFTLYATTRYTYDSEGNLTQIQDAHGNITTMTYDKLGRKIAMDDPDMGSWTYKYDLNGNLIEQTDAKGQTIYFTYDDINRLVNKTDGGAFNVDYTYDDMSVDNSKGRLTQAQYPGGETNFKYDEIGREIESIKKINNQNYGVKRNYDALNNLINIEYPDQEKIFYKYNDAGQIEGISNDETLLDDQQSFNWDQDDGMKLANSTSYIVHRTSLVMDDREAKKQRSREAENDCEASYVKREASFVKLASTADVRETRDVIPTRVGIQFYMDPRLRGDGRVIDPDRNDKALRVAKHEIRDTQYALRDTGIDVRSTKPEAQNLRESFSSMVTAFNPFYVKEAYADTVELVTLEAEDMEVKTTGGSTTGGWNIWSNGYIENGFPFPDTATYEFEIIAKGEYAGGGWPNMQLRIDQQTKSNITVNASGWTSYFVEADISVGSHNVAVAFTNDYYDPGVADRNLYVDKVIIREITEQTPVPTGGLTFIQDTGTDGIVSMEAGHYAANTPQDGHQWALITRTGQSGTGSLQALPNSGTNNNTGYVDHSPRLDYTVNFTKTGTLYVWVRGIGLSGNDDSCHVGLDGEGLASSNRISSFNTSWTWSRSTMDGPKATMDISSIGEHTVNVWMREDGFIIDKIVLTTNSDYTPTDYGPDETVGEPLDAIDPPILNAASPGDGKVDLNWNTVTGATGYKVYYGTASGNYVAPIDVGNVASYTVSGLVNDMPYYFAVTAYDEIEESDYSDEESAVPTGFISGVTDYTQDPNCKGAWLFTEGSGTTLEDASGNGNTGNFKGNGEPAWNGTDVNFAMSGSAPNSGDFDDTDDYINSGSDSSIDDFTQKTVVAWIYLDGFNGVETIAEKLAWDPYYAGWGFWVDTYNSKYNLYLWNTTNGGDSNAEWRSTEDSVQMGTWVHVAFTFDRSDITNVPKFYVNGQISETTETASPAGETSFRGDQYGDFRIGGSLFSGARTFNGKITEVAVFDRVLSTNEINDIMNYGLRGPEAQLIVSYDFDEGGGSIVHDVSGYQTPADLTIADTGAVTWMSGALAINNPTILQSSSAPQKVIDAVQASEEMTVEVWANPANVTQSGPARIVSFSKDPSYRNFTLGQAADEYRMRLRTTDSTTNGIPEVTTPGGQINGNPRHIVFTHDSAGNEVIYVDGQAIATNLRSGSFSNWESGGYFLTIANEMTLDRPWLGELYHVSVYDGALSASQVVELYNQGLQVVPLAAPALESATAGDTTVDLSWSSVDGATGYKVYYGTASGTYVAPVDVGNVTNYTVSGLVNDMPYYFAVTAYDATQESGYSNEESATSTAPPAGPLAAPVLDPALAGDSEVNLAWSSVSGATGYKVKYGTVSGGGATAGTNFIQDPSCVAAWKLDESSGEVLDSCGVNNGTTSGAISRGVDGKYDQGIEFLGYADANNAIVHLGSDASLDNLGSRTITAWIYPHSYGGYSNRGTILAKDYQDGWIFRLSDNYNIAFSQAFTGGVVTWITTTNAIQFNSWQHVAVVYAGSGISDVPTIYINGEAQSITGWTPYGSIDNDASKELQMGIKNTIDEFDGVIDEVAIFNRMFSEAEINEIMNNGLAGGAGGTTYESEVDAGDVTNYTVSGLTNNTTYYFVVTAYNSTEESAASNEESATPVAPVVSEPQMFVSDVQYNAQGQMTQITYGNGVVTTNTYDPQTFRLARIETRGPAGESLQDLSYTYDPAGNVLSITDNVNSATQTFQYDALNRLVEAAGETYGTKTYAYDEIGNIKEKDGRLYFYGEGGAAGPHAVTSLSDGTTFTYDDNGNMTAKQAPDLITTGYEYDIENRLVKVTRAGAAIAEYNYDGDGGRVSKTAYDSSNAQGTCFLKGTPVLMADGTLRPIEDVKVGDVVVSFDERYAEEVVSTVTAVFAEEETQDFLMINGALRVTENHPFYREGEWREAGSLAVGDKLLNLSLNDVPIRSIQKIHVQKPVRVYNIEVDRYHNYFVTRGRSEVEGYLVHNKFPGESSNAVFEGTTYFVGSLFETNDVRSTKYVFLGGMRIASVTNGKVMFYHGDHLGGTNILTDDTGALKELIEYEPYGTYARHEKFGLADEVARFYFTGKQTDDESGLMYYGARYYDPDIGRFITADTIVPGPLSPQSFNRYSYVYNNPVNFVDPTGNFGFLAALLFSGFATTAIVGSTSEAGRNFVEKWGDFINPLARAVVTNDWQNLGMQAVNAVGLMSGNMWMSAASGLSYASRSTSHIGDSVSSEISRGLGYAGMGIAGGYTAYKVGAGIINWAGTNETYYEINAQAIQKSSIIEKAEIIRKYGEKGVKISINGMGMDLNSALNMAARKGANILFYNPTAGPIADFVESGLDWFTGTGSLSRQLGNLATQLRVDLIGYSQGSIIASNALIHAAMKGGVVQGSTIEVVASGVGSIRLNLSAQLAGVTEVYAQTKKLDAIRLISSELNPFGYAQGAIGLATGIGLKQHSSY